MKNLVIPIVVLTFILAFASCQTERTAETVNAEITQTRNQIAELNVKLEKLQQEWNTLQPEQADKAIKVGVQPVERKDFSDYILSTGTVEAVKAASISPEMSGKIESIPVREGQWVKKGQVLLNLDSKVMQNGLAEMEKGYEMIATLYNKQKDLWDQGIGSEVQYLEIKNRKESMERSMSTLKSQLEMTRIIAPFAGRIEKILVKVGELASPGRGIINLVNPEKIYINTQISEAFIGTVGKGDTVQIGFPNLPGVTRTVPIDFTGQVIDPQSRTFTIRIELSNTNAEIKPNMLATVKIRTDYQPAALMVPTPVIRQDVKGSYLFVAEGSGNRGVARKTYVSTGSSDGNLTVINSGLSDGCRIVTLGYNQIKDGSVVVW
ncbi:MAG: efflux RND transporter periplasmic adaptor subunit [Candidatus Thermoplasmatota archaeon]